jgi:hypothetical protein
LAGANGTTLSAFLDVTQTGCSPAAIPNDGQDDAPAFNCALGMLSDGGILYVPPGVFELASTVVVQNNVQIMGAAFGGATLGGSVIHQPVSNNYGVLWLNSGDQLRNLAFTQDQPPPGPGWAPTVYDYQIKVEGSDIVLQDLFLLNPYAGILIGGTGASAIGRILISDVRGQPLHNGITIDNVLDVIHIEKIHFWPFWSYDPSVAGWMIGNGSTGIETLRCDNPQFSQLFFFNYEYGLYFGQSSCANVCGVTSKAKITQLDADSCIEGVHIAASGVGGLVLDQFSVQNPAGTGGPALNIAGNNNNVLINEGDFANMWTNGIRVGPGSGNFVVINNSMVRVWALSGVAFPGVELVAGSTNSYVGFFNSLTGASGANSPAWSPMVTEANVQQLQQAF